MIHVRENGELKSDIKNMFTAFTRGTVLNANTLSNIERELMTIFFDYQCSVEHVKLRAIQTGDNNVMVISDNFYTTLLLGGIITPHVDILDSAEYVLLDGKYPIYKSVSAHLGMPDNNI